MCCSLSAKEIDGLDVFPYTHIGDTGIRKASARVVWTPPEDDDITGLVLQLRLQSDPTEIATLPTIEQPDVPAGETRLIGGFASLTAYALRGRWRSGDGWATEWALWIPFTTTDARVSEAALDQQVQAFLHQLDQTSQAALKPLIDLINERLSQLGHDVAEVLAMVNERIDGPGQNSIVNYLGNTNENVTDIRTISDGFAEIWQQAFAGDAIASANALLQMVVGAGPSGTGASLSFYARAVAGDLMKRAGLKVWAETDENGGDSGWELEGSKGRFLTPNGDSLNALLIATQDVPLDAPITTEGGSNVIRCDLTGRQRRHQTNPLDDAAEVRPPNGVTPMDYSHTFKMATGADPSWSDEFLSPKPTDFSTTAVPGVGWSLLDGVL